ncbi:zf-TFIIB domain-containing protein [Microbacterium neungamense]|uniref:TFIIB-type zinc ribbon-containing protein n=1 Tax=Microbacterium neungamense TaxID=2810535 RepID=UPI00217CF44F|nr:zf-TFIIB domain-containing protein [Microbacterium neungamense]UWF78111.1 zf-TFIIB domain-containing protein [Microbacterium neungamense]
MLCPADGSTLVMSERSGIEIDYCPQCRGVWLDRGELDKIIDRSVSAPQPAAYRPEPGPAAPSGYEPPRYDEPRYDQRRYDEPRYDDRRYDDRGHRPHKRKRESWLSELFD